MGIITSFQISTEIPQSYMEKLFDFVQTKYLLPQKQRFTGLLRSSSEGYPSLSYTVLNPQGTPIIKAEAKGTIPIELKLVPFSESLSETTIEEAKQDFLIGVQIFEEQARKKTLYFAWSEGQDIVPEELKKQEKSITRLFLETQVLFFLMFIVFGAVVFIVVTTFYPAAYWAFPLILVLVQLVFVFFSTNFIARSADWHITASNPIIHLLEYRLPLAMQEDFKQTRSREEVLSIKKDIYEEVIAEHGNIDCEAAGKILARYGVSCRPDSLIAKKVDVYALVKKIADKFKFPMPKIVVSNTMVPNAAASGPSPSRGIVLITTGLLVQLEENEIISVLGHEFGHLRGRDPLILYGLTSAEFLFRFYVLFPLLPIVFSSFLFFIYFWAIMTVIFFIAKFFEARADLISAIVVGQPEVLADSLEKIGFQRLLYERTPSFRFQEWVGFDPHPPIYFRVDRLEKLEAPENIKHPLLQSIKDVLAGFRATF